MIRPARISDLSEIEELVRKAVKVMNRAGNDQWNETYPLLSDFETDRKRAELFVFLVDGEVAGIACFSEKEHEEYPEIPWSYPDKAITVKRAAVDPDYQGQGIAGQLYQYAEKVAKEKGISYIKTDTFSKNLPAQHVFERIGYRYVADKYMPDKQDRILYFEKYLAADH